VEDGERGGGTWEVSGVGEERKKEKVVIKKPGAFTKGKFGGRTRAHIINVIWAEVIQLN